MDSGEISIAQNADVCNRRGRFDGEKLFEMIQIAGKFVVGLAVIPGGCGIVGFVRTVFCIRFDLQELHEGTVIVIPAVVRTG